MDRGQASIFRWFGASLSHLLCFSCSNRRSIQTIVFARVRMNICVHLHLYPFSDEKRFFFLSLFSSVVLFLFIPQSSSFSLWLCRSVVLIGCHVLLQHCLQYYPFRLNKSAQYNHLWSIQTTLTHLSWTRRGGENMFPININRQSFSTNNSSSTY